MNIRRLPDAGPPSQGPVVLRVRVVSIAAQRPGAAEEGAPFGGMATIFSWLRLTRCHWAQMEL